MSIFSQVFKPYTFGGRGVMWKSTFFPYTFNFLVWFFIIFMGIFLALKTFWCVLGFFGGGKRSQKVCGVYTNENVDINGWPLKFFSVCWEFNDNLGVNSRCSHLIDQKVVRSRHAKLQDLKYIQSSSPFLKSCSQQFNKQIVQAEQTFVYYQAEILHMIYTNRRRSWRGVQALAAAESVA